MSDPDKAASRHPDLLNEAEETLRAIREGEVDALVIRRAMAEEVFSLQGWDDSYRAFMEIMDHGAAALGAVGEVLYANNVFCRFLGKSLSEFQGVPLLDSLPETARPIIADLLEAARTGRQTAEISLEHEGAAVLPGNGRPIRHRDRVGVRIDPDGPDRSRSCGKEFGFGARFSRHYSFGERSGCRL